MAATEARIGSLGVDFYFMLNDFVTMNSAQNRSAIDFVCRANVSKAARQKLGFQKLLAMLCQCLALVRSGFSFSVM